MLRQTLTAAFVTGLLATPALAASAFFDFGADLSEEPGVPPDVNTHVRLLHSFGAGVIATGLVDLDTTDGVPAVAGATWVGQDAFGAPPTAGASVVSFLFNPGGEYMGVEPSPFRVFLDVPGAGRLGELDFSGVAGLRLGSLGNITGLVLTPTGGGAPLTFEPFDVQAVPEPGSAWLVAAGLGVLAWRRRRRRMGTNLDVG